MGTPVEVLGVEGDWVLVYVFEVEIDGELHNDVTGYAYIDNVPGVEPEQPEEPVDPEEEQQPKFKVTIFSSRRSVMAPGEIVYLTSKLEGFEGYETLCQWQVDMGEGFVNVKGANEETYSFESSVETLSYDWRLAVYYR